MMAVMQAAMCLRAASQPDDTSDHQDANSTWPGVHPNDTSDASLSDADEDTPLTPSTRRNHTNPLSSWDTSIGVTTSNYDAAPAEQHAIGTVIQGWDNCNQPEEGIQTETVQIELQSARTPIEASDINSQADEASLAFFANQNPLAEDDHQLSSNNQTQLGNGMTPAG